MAVGLKQIHFINMTPGMVRNISNKAACNNMDINATISTLILTLVIDLTASNVIVPSLVSTQHKSATGKPNNYTCLIDALSNREICCILTLQCG